VVIDTSAVIAILFGEAESAAMLAAIRLDQVRKIGAPTLVECHAVMVAKKGKGGSVVVDAFLERLGIEIEPFSNDAADFARQAYSKYGKGVGSPGVLNYGDCLSYGAAQALGQPLLFKGDDFSKTTVVSVRY
jgi:ribonuclease VapC